MSTPLSHAFWQDDVGCWRKDELSFLASSSLLHHCIPQRASCSSTTSALAFLRTACTYCEMERGDFWQNHLISTEGGGGCWKLGSGVMVLQQCLPGKVVPHHCQLPSDKERGDGECGPYLLIKQLKTLAVWVTRRKSYLWVCAFTATLSELCLVS